MNWSKVAGPKTTWPILLEVGIIASGDSCGLFEVGLRYVLDLAASHRLGHLCLPLNFWTHCSFLRDLDLSLKLFDIPSTRSFQDVRMSLGTLLVQNSRCKFCGVFRCNHTLLVQPSVSLWFWRLKASKFALSRSCWRTESHRSYSLFHDLVVRFDRHAA